MRIKYGKGLLYLIILFTAIFLISVSWRFKVSDWIGNVFSSQLSFVGSKISFFKSLAENLGSIGELSVKIGDLETENLSLRALLAQRDGVENENIFLRRALLLDEKIQNNLIAAGVYYPASVLDNSTVMLNKGKRDNVAPGDAVITARGVLIGRVMAVDMRTSRIALLTNSDLQIMGRVQAKETSGIVKGQLQEGLTFELIMRQEDISVGDMVLTSGTDTFPAGLLVGPVRDINEGSGAVFKKVVIHPSFWDDDLGSVFVIKN